MNHQKIVIMLCPSNKFDSHHIGKISNCPEEMYVWHSSGMATKVPTMRAM